MVKKTLFIMLGLMLYACQPAYALSTYASHEECKTPEWVVDQNKQAYGDNIIFRLLLEEEAEVYMSAYNRSEPVSNYDADMVMIIAHKDYFELFVLFFKGNCLTMSALFHPGHVKAMIEGRPLTLDEQEEIVETWKGQGA